MFRCNASVDHGFLSSLEIMQSRLQVEFGSIVSMMLRDRDGEGIKSSSNDEKNVECGDETNLSLGSVDGSTRPVETSVETKREEDYKANNSCCTFLYTSVH
ncbi:unnamed protein product, partial [Cuscuta europaea]